MNQTEPTAEELVAAHVELAIKNLKLDERPGGVPDNIFEGNLIQVRAFLHNAIVVNDLDSRRALAEAALTANILADRLAYAEDMAAKEIAARTPKEALIINPNDL